MNERDGKYPALLTKVQYTNAEVEKKSQNNMLIYSRGLLWNKLLFSVRVPTYLNLNFVINFVV